MTYKGARRAERARLEEEWGVILNRVVVRVVHGRGDLSGRKQRSKIRRDLGTSQGKVVPGVFKDRQGGQCGREAWVKGRAGGKGLREAEALGVSRSCRALLGVPRALV